MSSEYLHFQYYQIVLGMKKILFLLLPILIVLQSCSSDSSLQKEIKALENVVDNETSPEKVRELITKYTEYINTNPEDEEMNGRYAYRAASRHLQTNNPSAAIKILDDAVKTYGSSSITPNNLFLIANTYGTKFKQAAVADTYYQALVEGFPSNEYAEKAKGLIKKSRSLETKINDIKDDIFIDSTQTRVDPRKARNITELYKLYCGVLPDSPNTPQFLYNTYNIANSARMFKDAAFAAERLYKKYPNHEKAATAMFLSAFVYENELRDLDKAKSIYEEFIKKHPNNEFASSAEVALANLGKPADEMLKNIQQQNTSGE